MTMMTGLYGVLIATQLTGTWFAAADADTRPAANPPRSANQGNTNLVAGISISHNNPAISVSPRTLDFASVRVGGTKDLTFAVRNVGWGMLTGAAKVSAPFRIVRGSPYVLGSSQSQDITVRYLPKASGLNMAVVLLTGGGGGSITVAGSGVLAAPAAPRRPATPIRPAVPTPPTNPAPPQNLRLLADR